MKVLLHHAKSRLRFMRTYLSVKRQFLPVRLVLVWVGKPFLRIRKGHLNLEELRNSSGDMTTIVEAGANSGTDTLEMLRVFPRAKVICFEPDPRAIRAWRNNVKSTRAELRTIAISDYEGDLTFHQSDGIPPGVNPEEFPEGWHLSGSLLKPKNHSVVHEWSSFERSVQVRCETLDHSLRIGAWSTDDEFPIGLIWADVQGAEGHLIRGAEQSLKRTRFFYTEYSNDELYEGQLSLRQLLRMLPGFEVAKIWTNDVLLRNKLAF